MLSSRGCGAKRSGNALRSKRNYLIEKNAGSEGRRYESRLSGLNENIFVPVTVVDVDALKS
jgi:hypothetical protein